MAVDELDKCRLFTTHIKKIQIKKLVRTFSDSMNPTCILRKSHLQSWARQDIQCAQDERVQGEELNLLQPVQPGLIKQELYYGCFSQILPQRNLLHLM